MRMKIGSYRSRRHNWCSSNSLSAFSLQQLNEWKKKNQPQKQRGEKRVREKSHNASRQNFILFCCFSFALCLYVFHFFCVCRRKQSQNSEMKGEKIFFLTFVDQAFTIRPNTHKSWECRVNNPQFSLCFWRELFFILLLFLLRWFFSIFCIDVGWMNEKKWVWKWSSRDRRDLKRNKTRFRHRRRPSRTVFLHLRFASLLFLIHSFSPFLVLSRALFSAFNHFSFP